jgi:hypothetical protein
MPTKNPKATTEQYFVDTLVAMLEEVQAITNKPMTTWTKMSNTDDSIYIYTPENLNDQFIEKLAYKTNTIFDSIEHKNAHIVGVHDLWQIHTEHATKRYKFRQYGANPALLDISRVSKNRF